jgi:hypothetical protein
MFNVGLNKQTHVHSPREVIDRGHDWRCKGWPEYDRQVPRFHHVRISLLCYPTQQTNTGELLNNIVSKRYQVIVHAKHFYDFP